FMSAPPPTSPSFPYTTLFRSTTILVDHHASPNAIDGSLDLIAEAFSSLGIRSVLCYEVTDRDGPERARAGIEENRRFLKEGTAPDRKSTRLNSSHSQISYAVF